MSISEAYAEFVNMINSNYQIKTECTPFPVIKELHEKGEYENAVVLCISIMQMHKTFYVPFIRDICINTMCTARLDFAYDFALFSEVCLRDAINDGTDNFSSLYTELQNAISIRKGIEELVGSFHDLLSNKKFFIGNLPIMDKKITEFISPFSGKENYALPIKTRLDLIPILERAQKRIQFAHQMFGNQIT